MNRIVGNRNFANKIWNAARFVIGQTETVAGGINDHDFHTRERPAGRAHLCAVFHRMIFRRQRHDRAGRLGHAVHLHEAAAEHFDALAQEGERNRTRAGRAAGLRAALEAALTPFRGAAVSAAVAVANAFEASGG